LDVFIVGTAIGLSKPMVAIDVSVEKLGEINWLLGEHYVIRDRRVRKEESMWSWTEWVCPNNPDSWLFVGVLRSTRRRSSEARAAAL
jgi:hypothetical protein